MSCGQHYSITLMNYIMAKHMVGNEIKTSIYNIQTHRNVVFPLIRHKNKKDKDKDNKESGRVLTTAALWENVLVTKIYFITCVMHRNQRKH